MARHRSPKVPHRGARPWVFLASSRMQELSLAEDPGGVLARQDRRDSEAGSKKPARTPKPWLVRLRHLGM